MYFNKTHIWISLCLLILGGCNNRVFVNSYQYADGSGNEYILKGNILKYDPVKPIESSSGIYSGGDSLQMILSDEAAAKIVSAFENAFSRKEEQVDKREMMTGLVSRMRAKKVNSCIIRSGSNSQKELESVLKAALK